jgi:hypothetical protein
MEFRKVTSILCLLTPLGAATAMAQTSTGGSTTTALAESDFSIYVQGKSANGTWSDISTDDAKVYFNRARCECGTTVRFVVQAASSTATTKISNLLSTSGADGEARLYLGQNSGCTTDPDESSYGCVLLDQIDSLSSLAKTGTWTSTEMKISDLFSSEVECATLKTTYVWFWIDTASDGSADLTGTSAPSLSLRLDGKGPSAPTGLGAQSGKEALILSWDAVTSSSATSDLAGFLAFCAHADGSAGLETSVYKSQFVSPASLVAGDLCPDQDSLSAQSLAATLDNLDPAFLCSGLIGSGQTSHRLKGLTNNVPYTVVLVAVDDDGNLGLPSNAVNGTPALTVDFYNEYANEGGEPVGGYCNVASGAARPGAMVIVLVGGIALIWRRRLGRAGPWPIAVLGMLGARAAFGQAILHDDDTGIAADMPIIDHVGSSSRSMAVEFRVGPYLPNVDSGLSGGATPHRNTFGDSSRMLYQLEVDYDLLQTFGTMAVGVGIGYFTESAKAFAAAADGTSNGTRSADDTSLRLIPISLVAVYRMDLLALRWHVPLVPYVKAGLNYTFWKVTDGNGDVAALTQGGQGAGGTLGWQATAGIALQLDGLDAGAMRELDSESGLNHVYAFWDYSHIDASGLGMGHRLHVGDDTWSAGLLVEF